MIESRTCSQDKAREGPGSDLCSTPGNLSRRGSATTKLAC